EKRGEERRAGLPQMLHQAAPQPLADQPFQRQSLQRRRRQVAVRIEMRNAGESVKSGLERRTDHRELRGARGELIGAPRRLPEPLLLRSGERRPVDMSTW